MAFVTNNYRFQCFSLNNLKGIKFYKVSEILTPGIEEVKITIGFSSVNCTVVRKEIVL